MVPVITPDVLGLMILIKIDSSSLFLKIFYVYKDVYVQIGTICW